MRLSAFPLEVYFLCSLQLGYKNMRWVETWSTASSPETSLRQTLGRFCLDVKWKSVENTWFCVLLNSKTLLLTHVNAFTAVSLNLVCVLFFIFFPCQVCWVREGLKGSASAGFGVAVRALISSMEAWWSLLTEAMGASWSAHLQRCRGAPTELRQPAEL